MDEKTYVFEGKTTNEAIEKGLKELNTTKNKVDIKVLEDADKKTFFSILAPKVVKVEIKIKEKIERDREPVDFDQTIKNLDNFIKEFISKLPTKDLQYEIRNNNNTIEVDIKGDEASYLIGYRGEALNSLQDILVHIASQDKQERVRVLLNISNYREKRKKDLETLSSKIAESVEKSKKSVTLEPMVAYDRKVIHSFFQNSEKIETHSIGKEPYRKVVISLK